jgi:hypothetical protein
MAMAVDDFLREIHARLMEAKSDEDRQRVILELTGEVGELEDINLEIYDSLRLPDTEIRGDLNELFHGVALPKIRQRWG